MKSINRTAIILSIVFLAGWLAWLKVEPEKIAVIIGSVSAPAAAYIALKGTGNQPRSKGTDEEIS